MSENKVCIAYNGNTKTLQLQFQLRFCLQPEMDHSSSPLETVLSKVRWAQQLSEEEKELYEAWRINNLIPV